ncbi:MAG TPA: DUF92 domain-containing protein [Bacteroidetes bacterium]|nr:DUF92 domain-containing protein [Bacteroidota bacterium]
MLNHFFLAVFFGAIIAAGSFYARFLTRSGAMATFLLAVIIYGFGSWQFAIPILTFFILSSLLSQKGKQGKVALDQVFEKPGARDGGQVAANGGIAGLLAIVSYAFPVYDFYPLYLGAIAAVTADTWGTEIGVLTRGVTLSVVNFKPVSAGTSGGISERGSLASIAGATTIAASGYYWYTDLRTALAIVVAGVSGSLLDSILGATLQTQYRCQVCGRATERREHCEQPTRLESGLTWIDNDVVNWACALAGAGFAMLLSMAL